MSAPFAEGQVVTVFRSRLRADADPGYEELNRSLLERARALGGLVDATSFVAEDGERVTIVTFADRAHHERWATDEVHREAQRLGRRAVYERFSLQVGVCDKVVLFEPDADPDR